MTTKIIVALALLILVIKPGWAQDNDSKPPAALPDLPIFDALDSDDNSVPEPMAGEQVAELKTEQSILTKMELTNRGNVGRPHDPHGGPLKCTCCDQSCDYSPSGLISRSGILSDSTLQSYSIGDRTMRTIGDSREGLPASYRMGDQGIGKVSFWDQGPANAPAVPGRQPLAATERLADIGQVDDSTVSQPWVQNRLAAGLATPFNAGSCQPPGCRGYVSMFAAWLNAEDFEDSFIDITAQPVDVRGTFRDGWVVGLAGGRFVRPQIRSEVEFAYRTNDGDQWLATSMGTTATSPFDGQIRSYSGMWNLYWDRGYGNVRPYIGGGTGFSFVNANLSVGATQFNADESSFAYQGILGVAIEMKRQTECFSEYRYFGTDDVILANSTTGRATPLRYNSHNLFFGVRFYR